MTLHSTHQRNSQVGNQGLHTSGCQHWLCSTSLVYTGAQTLDDADPQFTSLPVLTQAVLHLVSPYLGKGHHVFCGRFTSGTNLSRAANTIHRHKCQKQSWSSFTLGDSDNMQFRCEQLIVIVWRAKSEKTPVIMVSSACSAGMIQVDNRKGEVLQKPVVVDTYNHSMNGVDRNDQHCT